MLTLEIKRREKEMRAWSEKYRKLLSNVRVTERAKNATVQTHGKNHEKERL